MSFLKRFTLNEMLVVIAIIGLLASLLMPALQRAMESARSVACVNSKKGVMNAITQFCDNHTGYGPGGVLFSNGSVSGEFFWHELLNHEVLEYGSIVSYSSKIPGPMDCPVVPEKTGTNRLISINADFQGGNVLRGVYRYSTYLANPQQYLQTVLYFGSKYPVTQYRLGLRMNIVPRPSGMICVVDAVNPSGYYLGAKSPYSEDLSVDEYGGMVTTNKVSFRHNDGSAAAFLMGMFQFFLREVA